MAKSEKQRLKLLYLLKILWEESQEQHPIPMAGIIQRLESYEISAERKSVYSDIEYLKEFGLDIVFNPERKSGGYYLASRDFELPELKMLVDMVQASQFLSEKKSRELIKKLERLTDTYDAASLQRNVYVAGRPKSSNESVYYAVDAIHEAIGKNRGIKFQYQKYDGRNGLFLRNNGKIYEVSPYYLVWNHENYYLIAVDENLGEIRHYRVDRMKNIHIGSGSRKGEDLFQGFDLTDYTNAAFGMFGGVAQKVKLVCTNNIAGVIIDRFGEKISLRRYDEEHFYVTPTVVTSGQFYGWLAGLGTEIRIEYSQEIKEEYLLTGALEETNEAYCNHHILWCFISIGVKMIQNKGKRVKYAFLK